MEWLYPDEYVKSIHDIDYDQLFLDGFRGIMFDIDNTLAAYDIEHPSKEVIHLFEKLKNLGFRICLVSNNSSKRVYKYNENLKVHAYPRAKKPLTRNLIRAMRKMGVKNNQTVFVGDQLFTDVWAGNSLKFRTILVQPIQEKEQLITRVKRGMESLIIKRYMKKRNYR